ncbi:hypothetical protein GMMP15_640025 [Candidatus Magnetomoraceae bacterium gMMP-15]
MGRGRCLNCDYAVNFSVRITELNNIKTLTYRLRIQMTNIFIQRWYKFFI